MSTFFGAIEGWYALAIPIIAVTLSLMIPIVAIITEHFQKKDRLRTMERAIEHGIDIEGFKLEEPESKPVPYRSGMVSLAVGIGLVIGGRILETSDYFTKFVLVAGTIMICIGVALLINDVINRDRFEDTA